MATKDLVGQTFSRTLSLHIKDGENNYLDRRSDHFPQGTRQGAFFFLIFLKKKTLILTEACLRGDYGSLTK